MITSTGFSLFASFISKETLDCWYAACIETVGSDAHIAHYEIPAKIDLHTIINDSAVQSALTAALPDGWRLVHTALHNNANGATPLDWHSDDCMPWFDGLPKDAPPALRIWFFPQDVPANRGPLEIQDVGEVFVAACGAGNFLAITDMGLIHRQTPNTSGLPRFMIRLEFTKI